MLKITIIAIGRLRKGPLFDLCADYQKRLKWSLTLHELESKITSGPAVQKDEADKILQKLHPGAYTVALDERGKNIKSIEFAALLQKQADHGQHHIQFLIGGADGLTDEVRKRANLLLSFGQQTWPHMLARAMVLEQIYRAQQILGKHPYHRE